MHIYVLSSSLMSEDFYKIWKTKLTEEKLLQCYRRGLPNAEILEFYPSLNHNKDETAILHPGTFKMAYH